MKRLQAMRESLGFSKAKLSRIADLNASTIAWAEQGRFVPYPGQLAKMAIGLGYDGDPNDLLEEVEGDASDAE
jgi:transcriptional regulator with XRE-family HTH domain